MCLFIGLCAKKLKTPLSNGENWAIGLTATVVCLAVILIISIATQPTAQTQLNFKAIISPLACTRLNIECFLFAGSFCTVYSSPQHSNQHLPYVNVGLPHVDPFRRLDANW